VQDELRTHPRVLQIHQQIPGLLYNPGLGRVLGSAKDPDPVVRPLRLRRLRPPLPSAPSWMAPVYPLSSGQMVPSHLRRPLDVLSGKRRLHVSTRLCIMET
jgi:hypothetical protein